MASPLRRPRRARAALVPVALVCIHLLLTGCAGPAGRGEGDVPALTGDYLGQPPPGDVAAPFAPGIVSTGMDDRDLAITPDGDEILWCANIGNHTVSTILRSRRVDGRWTAPEIAPFAADTRHRNLEPCVSPDGGRLWFVSDRPAPGAVPDESGESPENADIWYCERTADGWGEPRNLGPPVNTDGPEFFPSVTRDGTLYFTRDDRATGQSAIWRARLAGGVYREPERLPERVNSTAHCFNACVAPDESFLIVPTFGRPDSRGGCDYYIVFRGPDDTWSEPVNLGERVNTDARDEWSPALSPDGRYLFFMTRRPDERRLAGDAPLTHARLLELHGAPRNGSTDIWWIDAGFLADLRPD
jgi:hypothetical protein